MRQKFITKYVKIFITNYDSFITKCDSYYKMRSLLQIAIVGKLPLSFNHIKMD